MDVTAMVLVITSLMAYVNHRANWLHVSGPLGMVVAGLIVGNHERALAMSDVTREHLDMFWELIDAILNCVLFVLIGLEVLVIKLSPNILVTALVAIVVTLLARLVTVALPLSSFGLPAGSWRVLTWGGLRGGRATVLAVTYSAVVFSILIQGLTIGRVAKQALPASTDAQEGA